MRVIAGKARSLPLKTLDGQGTRPTTDRIKETLFNILNPVLYGARFLDLFAGSGGIGIEALSRGCSFACFVDSSPAAVRIIRENLSFTHLDEQAEVLQSDVIAALGKLEGREAFDVIFMDPPYHRNLERQVLSCLAERKPDYLRPETLLIVEAALDTEFDYAESLGYEIQRVKKYKTNMHIFLRMRGLCQE